MHTGSAASPVILPYLQYLEHFLRVELRFPGDEQCLCALAEIPQKVSYNFAIPLVSGCLCLALPHNS